MARSLQFDIVANDKATGKISAVEGALSKFGSNLGKMIGGFVAFDRVVGLVSDKLMRAFEWGSGLQDAAAAVGLSVDQFQRLEYAAKQSGIETGKLQKAFLDLRKIVRDAASGNQQAVGIITALGFTQEQAANGSIDYMDALMRVSAAVSSAKTEQDKFNIVTAVFGDRLAQELIPALSKYDELKRKIAEAPVLSEQDADILDRMGDRWDRFGRRVDVALGKIATYSENPKVKALLALLNPMAFGQGMALERAAFGEDTPQTAPQSPTEAAQTMAGALAEAGKKAAKQSNQAADASSLGLPSMAAIGGAAGFKGGAGGVPRTETLLEQIEQNTRPAVPVPVNGGTNFTSGNYSADVVEFNMTAAAIRNAPRRRDRFAR